MVYILIVEWRRFWRRWLTTQKPVNEIIYKCEDKCIIFKPSEKITSKTTKFLWYLSNLFSYWVISWIISCSCSLTFDREINCFTHAGILCLIWYKVTYSLKWSKPLVTLKNINYLPFIMWDVNHPVATQIPVLAMEWCL